MCAHPTCTHPPHEREILYAVGGLILLQFLIVTCGAVVASTLWKCELDSIKRTLGDCQLHLFFPFVFSYLKVNIMFWHMRLVTFSRTFCGGLGLVSSWSFLLNRVSILDCLEWVLWIKTGKDSNNMIIKENGSKRIAKHQNAELKRDAAVQLRSRDEFLKRYCFSFIIIFLSRPRCSLFLMVRCSWLLQSWLQHQVN